MAGNPPELARREDNLVINPVTGQVVELDAPTSDLAGVLDDIRELEQRTRSAKQLLSSVLLDRMDRTALWTHREGGYEIKGDGPGKVEYDVDELRVELRHLIDEGLIDRQAAAAAVEEKVTYVPRARGLAALKKLGGRVREAIEACERPSEKPRRVTVKRVR